MAGKVLLVFVGLSVCISIASEVCKEGRDHIWKLHVLRIKNTPCHSCF